ncbi:MAG: hypothetical protein GX434_01800 [Peptococcaceae bacterium]|nr:hypothetical protein [Peptococcaceae bacterium]
MSKEEKLQILKMIEEGKISSSEGLELMDALDKGEKEERIPGGQQAKWLRIDVKADNNKTKAKVNIPLSLVDVGLKIGSKFTPELKEAGLDKLDLNEILQMVKDGAQGKIVEVDDEEHGTKVEVYVD